MGKFTLFSGSSNRPLALKIARELKIKLGRLEIQEFPNHEIRIRVLEDVKDKIVFILQSTIYPAERHIVELALIADAAKRKGAKKIVAIMPWFGYSPQDKVFREGEPLSSSVIIKMLEATPIDEFVVVDMHSNKVLRMFTKKVHHVSAMDTFIDYFSKRLEKGSWSSVALDDGAVERASLFAREVGIPLIKFEKTRSKKTGVVTFHNLLGDVKDQNIVVFDDYVSTGGTLIQSCDYLKNVGAKKCFYCITHFIVPETIQKVEKSSIDKLFISDSIHWQEQSGAKKIKVVSMAPMLAEFINAK